MIRAVSSEPVHLVIRYRDPRPDTPTIRLHQDVIGGRGTWFGKAGKGLGRNGHLRVQDQVNRDVPTLLFLVTRVVDVLHVHRGSIEQVSYSPPSNPEDFPAYYASFGLAKQASFWVFVRELLDVGTQDLSDMIVASSGRPILDSLRSSSPPFIVKRR